MMKTLVPSKLFLILANLIPLFGVFLFQWDVAAILVLYWLESVVIGVLNIPKILTSGSPGWSWQIKIISNLFTAAFFTLHYGIFTAVHGVFVASIFNGAEIISGLFNGRALFWTAVTFTVSHVFSMIVNFYGKKEYLNRQAIDQMMQPYGRVMVMHFVILFGGFLVQSLGSPIFALILLIVLKTGIDLVAHAKEHKSEAVQMAG